MKKNYEQRKQTVYDLMGDALYVPMRQRELAVILDVKKEDRQELAQILDELVAEGRVSCSKRGKYARAEEKRLVGTFQAHRKGYGFVTVAGEPEDIFIPASETNTAMHGDEVEILLQPQKAAGRRREGKVKRVLSRGTTQIVCTYRKEKGGSVGVPDDPKFSSELLIAKEHRGGAADGQKVVVEITDYGKAGKLPKGKVTEILGDAGEPGVDILSIVRAYCIPEEFDKKVLEQADRVAKPVSAADCAGRLDLRDVQMVTIDGEDAKDLDDAVSLRREGENAILGVHIADVTNYVQEKSALDTAALVRGTSAYLADRVVPMLPRALSNGICSLNQGEDRLALSCIMTISPKGEIIDHTIAETVICVDRRMNYTDVNRIVTAHDPALCEKYKELVPMLEEMASLSALLREKRRKRGAVDFDFPETKVILDENGVPTDLRPYERNTATRLIEDFMLAANETVAADFYWRELPFLYRTHERPDPEKLKKLAAFTGGFGHTLHIGGDPFRPKELQKLLDAVAGRQEEALISRLTLRSMKQARYTVENTGHFGLAADCYCHFTSPIRRYPDLQIHRIIKDSLRGRLSEKRMAHYAAILPDVAKHTSETERRADEAERETVKLKKVQYMEAHVGETFSGVISGVTEFGFFVELDNTVEGLVRVTELDDDFYRYYEDSYALIGEATGKTYKLGQRLSVVVQRCDRVLRTIDFLLG